jgi:pimeloyl-ACP methyl ester carboxylesterase
MSIAVRYKQEIQKAQKHLLADSQVYETKCGLVETAKFGEGPTVIISHGSGGGYDMGIWLAHLINGDYHFIAPSRFGYLRTPKPSKPTAEYQADTYAALLDTLNVQSAVIIGLSAGGPSALQFALCYPERCRGIIMLSAISCSIPALPKFLQVIYQLMLWSDFLPWFIYTLTPDTIFRANGVSRVQLDQINQGSEKRDLLHSLYLTTFPTSQRRDGIVNDMEQASHLPIASMQHIKTPALVIHAFNDPIVPFENGEYSAREIPHAQFIREKDGGHFCIIIHREKILPVVREFLNRCQAQG